MSNEAPQQTLKQPVQPPMQIELQNVKKVYPVTGGEVVALDNISLKIRKGDIFGIIGLSGAGKSTLIRCVNRLDTPTEGKILIDGQNVPDMNKQQLRQMRRKVSMIFQQFNLLMQQTVAKNIAYPMECIGVPRENQRPCEGAAGSCRAGKQGESIPRAAVRRSTPACRHRPRPRQRPRSAALRRSNQRP